MAKFDQTIFMTEKDEDHPYTMISNSLLRDRRLSFRARGLMCDLLSLPKNWILYATELEKNHTKSAEFEKNHKKKEGRESIQGAIDELREYGYLTLTIERNEKGRINKWIYMVHEKPVTVDAETMEKLQQKRENRTARQKRKQENQKRKLENLIARGIDQDPETVTPLLDGKTDSQEAVLPLVDKPQLQNKDFNKLKTSNVCVFDNLELFNLIRKNTKEVIGEEPSQEVINGWIQDAIDVKNLSKGIDITDYVIEKIDLASKQNGIQNIFAWITTAIKRDYHMKVPSSTRKSFGGSLNNAQQRALKKYNSREKSDRCDDRIVPAAQPGKYDRFYQVYYKDNSKNV